jgi:large subunit ribosomal protein L4
MATTATAYSKTGTKSTTSAKLDKSVFGVMPENHELLKLAYIAYLANSRINLAKTKTRGLVSGGGKKPHKQKGTGRARAGSIRDPQWRGGGIVFGPTGEENYTKKLSTGSKRVALRQALSLAGEEKRLRVIDVFENKDGKVAETKKLLGKIEATGTILLVVEQKDALVERATNNLTGIKAVHANYLNVYDIMNADTIVLSKKALDIVHEWLGKEKK